jgi:nicotinamidase-related amidase
MTSSSRNTGARAASPTHDLDVSLRQRGITHLVVIGLLANTCVEVTGRYAAELGDHVTLVKDATAAYSEDRMYAAHEWPHLRPRHSDDGRIARGAPARHVTTMLLPQEYYMTTASQAT